MSCTTETNACPQTVSDQCVRYTGPNITSLGIVTGDELSTVEAKIIQYLTPLLTGVGDHITINPADSCTVINQFLTAGSTHNSYELIRALSKAVCSVQSQVTAIANSLTPPTYTVGCLVGVTSTSTTAQVLQAAIVKLCSTATDLTALQANVTNNYVALSQINGLIAAYLASITPSTTQQNAKMVPYVAYEYYGNIANFNAQGVGIAANGFDKVYLCNGFNGTPDKRGVVSIGAISGIAGAALDPRVNPANPGNPNYVRGVIAGTNTTVLTIDQIPSHLHDNTATTSISPNPHNHGWTGQAGTGWPNDSGGRHDPFVNTYPVTSELLNVTLSASTTVTISNTGGGQAHSNIQPVLPCLYIMYIP